MLKLLMVTVAAVAVLSAGCAAAGITTVRVNGTVLDHYVKRLSNHDTYFITVLKDNGSAEVFVDTDSNLHGKYNSSNVFADAALAEKTNRHVSLDVTGYRSEYGSNYRNIISFNLDPATSVPPSH